MTALPQNAQSYYGTLQRYRFVNGQFRPRSAVRLVTVHDILVLRRGLENGLYEPVVSCIIWADGKGAAIGVTGDWRAVRYDNIASTTVSDELSRVRSRSNYAAHVRLEDLNQSTTILTAMAKTRTTPHIISEAVEMAGEFLDSIND